MTQFTSFIKMGTIAVGVIVGSLTAISSSFILTSASMSQSDLYEDVVTRPAEKVASALGFADEVKDKYREFVASDQAFLRQMGVPEEFLDVRVVLKKATALDELLVPLMNFGHWAFSWNSENRDFSRAKQAGRVSMYQTFLNAKGDDFLMLGINVLEDRQSDVYQGIYRIFGCDERKLTSFIFFHEFGHKLKAELDTDGKAELHALALAQGLQKEPLSEKEKMQITDVYRETYSDSFALLMMDKKYPGQNFENARDALAGLRLVNGERSHRTSAGVVKLRNDTFNLDEVVFASEKSAKDSVQYVSWLKNVDGTQPAQDAFSSDARAVNNRILQAREHFLTQYDNQDKPSAKPDKAL